ncbi:hypothetical protein H7673_10365 [Streptococcus dysgalactiae subsp. equisimilis]|nr:hypothetical protein [Streptococcus dysgalactiae subsp. equisimilis]
MIDPPDVYESNVHLFGATSSPFCANFALQKTALELDSLDPSTVSAVRDGFYVDDCLLSCTNVAEASELVQNLQRVLARGGFHLTKWSLNRSEALSSVSKENRAVNSVNLDLQKCSYQRALGILWDVDTDCLRFQVDLPDRPPTRRGILSTVASLYDPLGFVAPLLMPARSLLQDQCHLNMGWDVLVDETALRTWKKWLTNIRSISCLEIPRCLIIKPESELQLHVFADASTKGYGAVAYVRATTSVEQYSCKFLMGKSRVNPKKFMTVPRLELTAATLAVRLMRSLVVELKLNFSRVTMWTDSAIVLHCIRNTSTRFVTFVANRLRQIHDGSESSQWRHVPTSLNPADLASRGISDAASREMNFWLEGPRFLWKSENEWPVNMVSEPVSIDCLKYKHEVICANVNVANATIIDNLLSYFSSWFKLQRAAAWLARFSVYYSVMKGRHDISLRLGYLSVSELRMAQDNIVRIVLRQYFAKELKLMQRIDSDDRTWPKSSPIRNLNPILVNGIIRVGGRLKTSQLGFVSKHPVILPGAHHVTKLIIRHYNESNGHVGLSHTLATVRKYFWVIKGATTVKRVLRQYMSCRIGFSQVSEQVMANLPEARVLPGEFPFASVGIDYFGLILTRINRSVVKRYGCLFSCMKTRAVHIEVASSLTVDSFIMALMRFISRRGKPIEIFSDNGTNFVGADIELRKLIASWNQTRLSNEMLQRNIEWNFNPPSASHRGGLWERFIRSVRRILCSVSKEQILSDEVLYTYLTEVERILNDRPLVPVYDDSNVIDVLTPNKLLLLRSSEGLVEGEVDMRSRYTRQWRRSQHLARTFWKRWMTE